MNRLILPIPPSINHAYRNFMHPSGRRMRVPTAEAERFKSEAGWTAKAWRQHTGQVMVPSDKKVAVRIWYYWANARRRDTDNPLKLLQDSLTGILWEDDRSVLPQVMDFTVDRANPRVEIELEVML